MPSKLPRPVYALAWLTGALPQVPGLAWHILRLIGIASFVIAGGILAAQC